MEMPLPYDPTAYHTYLFDLDMEVKIEKRVITSVTEFFGELIGLSEVLRLLIFVLIAPFARKNYFLSMISGFYRENYDENC